MLKLLLLLAVPICFFEGRPLIREKKWKEMAMAGVLIGAACLIGLGKALGLPAPLALLARWLRPVGEMLFKRF